MSLVRILLCPCEKVSNAILWLLNRLIKVSDFWWIDSYLPESIHTCIDSFQFESSHQTLWLTLNRFIRRLTRINLHLRLTWIDSHMHWIVSSFMQLCVVFCCLNRFTHLVNRFTLLCLCEKSVLSPLSINSLLLITPNSLNHLHLFFLGLKNSLFIHSSRLNTFSLNHFVHWVTLIC